MPRDLDTKCPTDKHKRQQRIQEETKSDNVMGYASFSLVIVGECRNSISKQATTASYPDLASLFVHKHHPVTFGR
jgi:hypothetical protein